MTRHEFALVGLVLLSSGLCWLPIIVEPNLGLSPWLPAVFASFCAGLGAILSRRRWWLYAVAVPLGSFVGICSGLSFWWPKDGEAAALVPLGVSIETVLITAASALAAFLAHKTAIHQRRVRKAAWSLLVSLLVFGPVTLALTPPLVKIRVARNDRLAAQRFESLKTALERSADVGSNFCDGAALRRAYSGPAFSESNWRRIAGNYVTQDGYLFGIYCHSGRTEYLIDVHPAQQEGYGTRQFCSDQSRTIGCDAQWNSDGFCHPCGR